MAVDVNLNKLKMAIVERFNSQLSSLQLGHPYKSDKTLNDAISAIELLEGCEECNPRIYKLLDYYCLKLKR